MRHKVLTLMSAVILLAACNSTNDKTQMEIGKHTDFKLEGSHMTPEALWAMGRIGSYAASPDGTKAAYQVTYYSVE